MDSKVGTEYEEESTDYLEKIGASWQCVGGSCLSRTLLWVSVSQSVRWGVSVIGGEALGGHLEHLKWTHSPCPNFASQSHTPHNPVFHPAAPSDPKHNLAAFWILASLQSWAYQSDTMYIIYPGMEGTEALLVQMLLLLFEPSSTGFF